MMKITDHNISTIPTGANSPVDATKEANRPDPVRPVDGSEGRSPDSARLTLSGDVEEVARIADAARETPEVRTDLVEQIKAEMAEGELECDLDLLAARMLQDLGWPPPDTGA